MPKTLAHYRRKLAEKSIAEIIAGRLRWYKQSFQMNNWLVGKLVELFGNRVTIDGVTLSLDNPQIPTAHKSSVYFGIYEVAERDLARRYIDRSLPLVEVGASIGGVSCVTNRLLTDPTRHVVVECNPDNIPTLERNRDSNGCKFLIEKFALGYEPEVSFNIVEGGWMVGNLKGREGRRITVPTITLDQVLKKHGFDIISLISDSEGAEVELIKHEADILRKHVKRMIVETHPELLGAETTAWVLDALREIGFELAEASGTKNVFAFRNPALS